MKKILGLVLLVASIFSLSACAEAIQVGEFPELKANKAVEMSAQEMVELFSTIDYTDVDSESVRISVNGTFIVDSDNSRETTEYDFATDTYIPVTYINQTQLDLTLDAVLYAEVTQQVVDAKLFAEGTFDFSLYTHQTSYGGYEDESDIAVAGNAGAYFSNQYMYVRADVTGTIDDVALDADFKEKYNEQVTQEMWDEVYGQTSPTDGGLDSIYNFDEMLPSGLITLLESGDIDQIMEEIPNLKVYKDGTTYSVLFTLDKQDIIDNFMDVLISIATEMNEEMPTQTELDEMEQEYTDAINSVIDQLELEYVITIEEGRIVQMAMSLVFVGGETDIVDIDIDMALIIDFGVSMPKFPSDLDEYDPVDVIGSELNLD